MRAQSITKSRGPGLKFLGLLLGILVVLVHTTRGEHHHGHHKDDDQHQTEQEHKDEDYHKLSDRLDRITARLEHLDHHLDRRLSPKIRQKALSLDRYLSRYEEPHCDDVHYDCGHPVHQCISRLKVCDGHKDCRNGGDEKLCTLPTNTGDVFDGYQVYDHCDQGNFERAKLYITEVKVRPAYPAFPWVRAIIRTVANNRWDKEEVAYHLVGYYRFNTRRLVLVAPPGADSDADYAILCEFDGYNLDRCEAKVVNRVSLHECAKFVFYRKHKRGHDSDHHDDDHHDDDHHDNEHH